nr:PAS domain S-box protein [Candidatus Levybacteria bacterium]
MVEKLPVKLVSCKSIAESTYEAVFEYDPNLFSFNAGQYVRITIPKLKFEDAKGASRDFSIASSPNTKGSFSIAFRNTGSGFKRTLIEAEKGFIVEITGPQEIFSLKKAEGKFVVFIAGGIGITPFLSVIRFATEQKLPQKLVLLYGNSNVESAAYLEELKELERQNPNFTMAAVFTHITGDIIRQNVKDAESKHFCLAGPPEMVVNANAELIGMGIEKEKICVEEFSGYEKKTAVSDDAVKMNTEIKVGALLVALEKAAIVSATDIKGNIIYANDKFIEISKYSHGELLGQNHRILKSGYHEEAFYKNIWDTILAGKIWHGEIKNKAKDNTFYWVDSSIGPTFGDKGEITGYIAVRFPITQIKKTEEELVNKNQELEKMNRLMIGRELKMVELKKQIERLKNKSGGGN